MSKANLKKEISQMSAEQLREIILDAYDAVPEIKQYFEYFINPDEDKLLTDFSEFVKKEFYRSKRHNCKARVLVVKRKLKKMQGFGMSYHKLNNALLIVVVHIGIADKFVYLTDAHRKLVDFCIEQLLARADKTGQYSDILKRIDETIIKCDYVTFDIKERCRIAVRNHKEQL